LSRKPARRLPGVVVVRPRPVPDPGVGDTTDIDGIKRGYHLGAAFLNPHNILPKGPDL
jgi:hypothetical protein